MTKFFQKGSGAFKCGGCGRTTRHTGVQSIGAEVCPDCYELAGYYNSFQDGEDVKRYATDIMARCRHIVKKGGKLDSDAQALLTAVGAHSTATANKPVTSAKPRARKVRIGRPPRTDRTTVGRAVRVYLLPAQIKALRQLGAGKISAGIVAALART